MPYSTQEISQIISLRAAIEGISLDDEALAFLADRGFKTSLRYAVQLLTPAKILSKLNGKTNISKQEIEEIAALFWDAKSSAKLLKEQEAKYLQ
jgi:RuvB-like protein 1 (pontin 52)